MTPGATSIDHPRHAAAPAPADPAPPPADPPPGPAAAAEVAWKDVSAKKRVAPLFPEEARKLGIEEATCDVRFFIDEKGEPYDVELEACHPAFRQAVREAAFPWRFSPMIGEDGRPVKATFLLKMTFRLK